MAPLDTDVAIETPEHIVFHHRVAGPARRAVAQVLDLALCYAVVAIVGVLVLLVTPLSAGAFTGASRAGLGLVLLAMFAAQWVYFLVWEGLTGRSPGKMAVGIRVVTTAGRPIGWSAAALRNLLRAADILPTGYVAGVVAIALSPRFQRLGDLVAGTMVVVQESARSARPLVINPPATPGELAHVPEEISLDAEERAALELFLRRRESLGVARENELAAMVAPYLGDALGASHPDPSRLLALLHHRAVNIGRVQSPPSLAPRRERYWPSRPRSPKRHSSSAAVSSGRRSKR
jgi:uncharacterized RDD family membrane protein YckC